MRHHVRPFALISLRSLGTFDGTRAFSTFFLGQSGVRSSQTVCEIMIAHFRREQQGEGGARGT